MVNTLYHKLAQAKSNIFSDTLCCVKGKPLVQMMAEIIAD